MKSEHSYVAVKAGDISEVNVKLLKNKKKKFQLMVRHEGIA